MANEPKIFEGIDGDTPLRFDGTVYPSRMYGPKAQRGVSR